MMAAEQLHEWTPLLVGVPDAARNPRASAAAHTHVDGDRGSVGEGDWGEALSSRADQPRRRPFAREAVVWGALSLVATGAGAAVFGEAFAPPVRLLLRRHAELLYAFPYAMCAIVLLAAAALPQPSAANAPSTLRARRRAGSGGGAGGRAAGADTGGHAQVPAGAAAALAIAVALTLALLWGVAIGLCLVALGPPPILFVALPLAVLFCMSKFFTYLVFYAEAHRLGILDP
jgi:hypothetical protein